VLAAEAKRREQMDSFMLSRQGERLTIMSVLLSPPSEFWAVHRED